MNFFTWLMFFSSFSCCRSYFDFQNSTYKAFEPMPNGWVWSYCLMHC